MISGTGQSAATGDSLTFPISLRLTDASGAPLQGKRVAWSGRNGAPDDDTTRTDAAGVTSVRFVLGEVPGTASLVARFPARPDSMLFDFVVTPDTSGYPTISFDPFQTLDLKTYDGFNQTVHPDFVATPGMGPLQRFLVITPYPRGDQNLENPSIYTGAGSRRWRAPTGLRNPMIAPPASGYLSDPDIVYDPDAKELWLYYRLVNGSNEIFLVRSRDGVKWSAPSLTVAAPRDELVSPTVVRRSATDWLMWAVDAGSLGCGSSTTRLVLRHSTDGMHWGPAEGVILSDGAPMPWHLDVQWIASREEYWAFYSAKPAGSCGTPALMFASSRDGKSWTVRDEPVVVRGMNSSIADIVYRATFRYDPASDDLSLWISGASAADGGYIWATVFEKLKAAPLLEPEARVRTLRLLLPSMPLLMDGT